MTLAAQASRLHTIGSVCRRLQAEFPDISISKIRYLEDQGLLQPKRTRGGYRLFGEEDIERLETILRLQRDEFLPLRVIRQELASPTTKERRRRRAGLAAQDAEIGLDELCERAGISHAQGRELVEYGLLEAPFTEADADAAVVSARLIAAGADLRHLRRFVTAAGNQADLLEALVPKLRARSPEARQGALEDLHGLAELAQELSQLLFWRALRHGRDDRRRLDGAGQGAGMTVDLAAKIRDVPDFPKPGIVFKDIMPLLADAEALREAVEQIAAWAEPRKPDLVLGAEARGYITGGALACRLGGGFVAARKPGSSRGARWPRSTRSSTASTRSRCTPTRSSRASGC